LDGRLTEHQARLDFYETFDRHHNQDAGFSVTFDEFMSYYTCVSAVTDNDSSFQQLLTSAWNLDSPAAGDA